MQKTIQELINEWKQRVDDSQKSSRSMAIKHDKYHFWIGVSATALATMAAVALLAQVEEPRIKIVAGIVGMIAAILSAIQTFYSQAARAEYHRFVVSHLVHLRRDIELLERFVPERVSERQQRMREIDEGLSSIEKGVSATSTLAGRRRWRSILVGLAASIVLILALVLGGRLLEQIRAAQPPAAYGVAESVQQGVETWVFDPKDPLLKQRIILINTSINEMATQKAVTLLTYLDELDTRAPITMYLSSSGGYTKDAYAIAHAIRASASIVNTVALGDCFSACAQILASGTGDRKIARDSRIMIHTHSYPYDGDPHSNNTILYERELAFFREYSSIPLDWIDRQERFYYLTPEEAITYGIADGILE